MGVADMPLMSVLLPVPLDARAQRQGEGSQDEDDPAVASGARHGPGQPCHVRLHVPTPRDPEQFAVDPATGRSALSLQIPGFASPPRDGFATAFVPLA